MPIQTLTNISWTQLTSSLVNFTIFCPPNGGDLGGANPGLVLVTMLPLCKKKLGFDSYVNKILSFGGVEVAVTGRLGGASVIVAVLQTEP